VRRYRIFASLKLRIIAACVIAGFGAAVGAGAVVLQATQTELQRRILAESRSDRERMAAVLGSKLELLKDALTHTAAQVRPEWLQDSTAIGRFLVGLPALRALFDTVLAARSDGVMLARVERGALTRELPNIADREYFQRAMAGDQPVVSEPVVGRVSNTPLVVIAVPVLGPDGRAVGVVGGVLRLQSNSLFTDPSARSDDGSRDLVINRQGTLLSHTDGKRIMGWAGEEAGFEHEFARWRDDGSPIDTRAVAAVSGDHVLSMAGIPLSDWAIVRISSREAAFAPMAAARRAAAAAAGVSALVSSLLAGLVAWAVARPIGQLRDRAERMCAGEDESIEAWPRHSGEIGAMSAAFEMLLNARAGQREQLQSLLAKLQAVLDNAEVGLVLTRDGLFELVSRPFCQTLGYERDQVVGQTTSLIHPSDEAYEVFAQRAFPAFMASGLFDGEVQLRRANGSLFWARMRGRAVVPGDRSQGTIWAIVDATAEHDQRARLSWAASHDRLTGLMNRAAFEALLEPMASRAAEEPFCVLFIDLDRFKQVNDTGGHAAGDALLRDLAQRFGSGLRKTDTVARLGGDEFAVLLPGCPIPLANRLAEELRVSVENYRLDWDGHLFGVGASIGVVVANGTHASAAEVMRAADSACYLAKRGGRNRVAMAID
jgi:diguanylate cyclase (GGDEF)-like protein/PAS domain S-box-containing protein